MGARVRVALDSSRVGLDIISIVVSGLEAVAIGIETCKDPVGCTSPRLALGLTRVEAAGVERPRFRAASFAGPRLGASGVEVGAVEAIDIAVVPSLDAPVSRVLCLGVPALQVRPLNMPDIPIMVTTQLAYELVESEAL